jgi:hypothetical protein
VHRNEFKIFADYHQFYLMDDDIQPPIPADVTNEDCRRRIKVAPHIVVVYPVRNMTVPVAIEVLNAEPNLDLAAWDHVAECSLDIPSGRIVIAGCTDYLPECSRVTIKPGAYRARVLCGGLDTLSKNGLEGDDHYEVLLWPAPPRDLEVLKQYES